MADGPCYMIAHGQLIQLPGLWFYLFKQGTELPQADQTAWYIYFSLASSYFILKEVVWLKYG